jgi:hypothetical protein
VRRAALTPALLGWLAAASLAAAQIVGCPPGTKHGSAATATGKYEWCERPAPGAPVRHGPLVGFHPNGRRSLEVNFVDGTPRGPIRAWYESGEVSASGETRPDNGILTLRDERGRKRAQIDVRDRAIVAQAWDEQGREEPYEKAKLAQALPANRDLLFIMNLWAVGIGIP